MNRAERDSLTKWAAFADTVELRDAIVRELGVRQRLKLDRAPDLSAVIDRLTVLVAAWCRRHGGAGLIHKTTMAIVDKGGDLWITEIGPVRARVKVERGEAVEVSAEAEAAIADMAAERRAAYRSRADRLIAAARRLIDRGEELSSAGLARAMGAGFSTLDVAALVKRMRSYGDWPQELGSLAKKRKAANAKLMAGVSTWREPPQAGRPRLGRPRLDEPRPPDDGAAWAGLGPEFPRYEGTIDGRLRVAETGREIGFKQYLRNNCLQATVDRAGGGKTTLTPAKVMRLVAAALGVAQPPEATRRRRRGKPDLEHIDFNA